VPLARLRTEYRARPLRERDCPRDPLVLARAWIARAVAVGLPEPNAMALATADARGRPSVRMVLLKDLDHGFVFFTHYRSRKGRDLERRARGALVFHWQPLHRQLRAEGLVRRLAPEDSDVYFATRPRDAQHSAVGSPQSRPIRDRSELERRVRAVAERYAGREVPRPASWGGYILLPSAIEFWQGRPHRLHDRIRYERRGRRWSRVRLAP
jgi:pyridoxamine 5'-phosphate oxidase